MVSTAHSYYRQCQGLGDRVLYIFGNQNWIQYAVDRLVRLHEVNPRGATDPFVLKNKLALAKRGLRSDINPSYNMLLTPNGLHRGAGILAEGMQDLFVGMMRRPAGLSRVGHVINGGDNERDRSYIRWTESALTKLGFEVVPVDLTSIRGRRLKKAIYSFDAIYIEGGNSFYLLKTVRRSRLDRYLRDWLDDGRLLVGMCAGAKILGPGLHITLSKNETRLRNLRGIGVVPFDLWMHYEDRHEQRLSERSLTVNYPVIPLRNSEAIRIFGGRAQLVIDDVYDRQQAALKEKEEELAALRRAESVLQVPSSVAV